MGLFDFNGAVYSRFAKNFLVFGFLKTKMSPNWYIGSLVWQNFDYCLHHQEENIDLVKFLSSRYTYFTYN
jgi:hypothetical protein